MSASREKKQRRDTDASPLSSRAQEELAKEEKRKRNTIIYTIIGIVVVILVAVLLIWDSGIIQRKATVATIDGEKVTAAQVSYYYYNNTVRSMAQTYYQLGMSDYYPYSLTESPKDQVITAETASMLGLAEEYVGQTFHDYFLDYALNALRQEYALREAAAEAGYTLSDEGKASVESTLESLDSGRDSYLSTYGVSLSRTTYLQMIYGDSMTERSYRTCLENAQLATEFYDESFTSLADYTDEELDAYYQENKDDLDTFTCYYQYFNGQAESTTDEDGNTVSPTEEESSAALAQAEENANAALDEVEAAPDSVKDNEDFTEITDLLSAYSSYYSWLDRDWLTDSGRQEGDAAVFESASGFYLVVFDGRYLDETPTVNVRHILVEAVHEDDPDTEDVDESQEALTDEDYAIAEQKAQEILDQWKAGEATEDSFAALAEEYSADAGSNTNGGLYEKVYDGQMIETFNDWIFDSARQSGDTGLVKNDNESSSKKGWHIIYYIGQDEPVWITSSREGKWLSDLKTTVEIERTGKLDSFFD